MISANVDFSIDDEAKRFAQSLADVINVKRWHEVGTTGEPAYQNSWTTTSSKHFGYRLLSIINSVQIHGRLTPGTETDNTVIFTLPLGYRPTKDYSYTVATDTAGASGARFEVQSDGDVAIVNADTSGTFYDVNIIFPLGV